MKKEMENSDNHTIWTSENGHLKIIKYLKESGADVTVQNNYAIRWASYNCCLEVVEYPLFQDVDINQLTPKHKIYFSPEKSKKLIYFA